MRPEPCFAINGNLKYLDSEFRQKITALEAIVDKLPVVVIVLQLNPAIVKYMSPNGLEILGFSPEKIQEMGEAYKTFFNRADIADYRPKHKLFQTADDDKFITFFQQARPSRNHDWNWYLGASKVFMRDENNRPTHIITTASPVDPMYNITVRVNRLLGENNFLRYNQRVYDLLTTREKEILKLMALGRSSAEMASELHISAQTAITHRRNIKAKLKAEKIYDIMKFARAFALD